MKLSEILESASSGATSSGSIASIAAPIGGTVKRNKGVYDGIKSYCRKCESDTCKCDSNNTDEYMF